MPEGKEQERTEQATPKRRAEARRKGQVAQSREVPSVMVLMSSLGVLFFSGTYMFWRATDIMRGVFQNLGNSEIQGVSAHALLLETFQNIFVILAPLMLFVLIAGVGGNVLQNGFLFTLESLTPKLSKLNPISGVKKFISLRSLTELVKAVFKVSLIGFIAFLMVKGELKSIPQLIEMGVVDILAFIGRVSFKIWFYTCLALILLAALDYAFQRWQHERDLKMTKQEVKDELKQREGDPAVKSRIRSIQREMARRRMMDALPNADVVVTNPTKLAIALRYDSHEMNAPRVLAKGAGFIAQRIREIAIQKGIPIVEQKPLAQALYKSVEIGDSIPVDLYKAVAEVLAYVYRLKGMISTAR